MPHSQAHNNDGDEAIDRKNKLKGRKRETKAKEKAQVKNKKQGKAAAKPAVLSRRNSKALP